MNILFQNYEILHLRDSRLGCKMISGYWFHPVVLQLQWNSFLRLSNIPRVLKNNLDFINLSEVSPYINSYVSLNSFFWKIIFCFTKMNPSCFSFSFLLCIQIALHNSLSFPLHEKRSDNSSNSWRKEKWKRQSKAIPDHSC